MYIAALEAGMGDNTHVHGTFDMAQWQVLQFDEHFGAQPEATMCADLFHTMDYARFIAEGLPIGSGEVEGRIRHILRRCLDVPGDWREENLILLTALLTIRHSGRWDDFWDWQDRRDKKRFQRRLLREGLNRFRGPRKPRLVTEGTEKLDLDGLSPLFQCGDMA